jgi:hypothetical protein
MMSKIFIFVFALAIMASVSNQSGFQQFTDSRTPGSAAQDSLPATPVITASDMVDPYKTHTDLKASFENYGKTTLQLTVAQINAAKQIVDAVTALFKKSNALANARLCAYLIATAYVDYSLTPAEEKLSTDATTRAVQQPYFDNGFQGRGYAFFTGPFNYNRFAQYIGTDIASTPSNLLKSKIAAKVLAYGAINGKFTGMKLARFIPESGNADFVSARNAINGDINSDKIATFAQQILA